MNNNLHLIPQIIFDIADKLESATQEHERVAYRMRLEAIRDFCNQKIPPKIESEASKAFKRPEHNGKFSRIGLKNV